MQATVHKAARSANFPRDNELQICCNSQKRPACQKEVDLHQLVPQWRWVPFYCMFSCHIRSNDRKWQPAQETSRVHHASLCLLQQWQECVSHLDDWQEVDVHDLLEMFQTHPLAGASGALNASIVHQSPQTCENWTLQRKNNNCCNPGSIATCVLTVLWWIFASRPDCQKQKPLTFVLFCTVHILSFSVKEGFGQIQISGFLKI